MAKVALARGEHEETAPWPRRSSMRRTQRSRDYDLAIQWTRMPTRHDGRHDADRRSNQMIRHVGPHGELIGSNAHGSDHRRRLTLLSHRSSISPSST